MKIENIFDRNINDFRDIHLFDKLEFEEGSVGFSVDSEGNKLDDWIGNNYVVIGIDRLCGDPLMVDTSNSKFPVFVMAHDDHNLLMKIANSYIDFVKILNLLSELKDNKLTREIRELAGENFKYYSMLIEDED